MEKDDGNDPKCENNCFVTFAEAEFNGDKFWAVLLGGKLDNDGVHKPFLVDMTKIFRTPTGSGYSFYQNNDSFDQIGTTR